MKRLVASLWRDEHGVILSTEIVVVGSVLVIGLLTGMTCLQEAVNGELDDLAGAIGSLDQSYSFAGQVGDGRCSVCTAGSSYRDCEERCKSADINGNGCHRTVIPCQAGGCDETPCGSCGSSSCGGCGFDAGCGPDGGCRSWGGCGSYDGCGGFAGAGYGSQCLSTGVPSMKVTEWPSVSVGCDPCESVEPKQPFMNIPDCVW